MFYLVQELLAVERLRYSTQKGLISEFGRRHIKEGDLDPEFGRILSKGYERRMFGDYGQTDIVSREMARTALDESGRFLREVKKLFPDAR